MAALTASRSVVGATATEALPLKDTRPTLMLGGSWSTNALAAAWAASMRVGVDVGGLHRQRGVDGQHDRGPLLGDLRVAGPAGRTPTTSALSARRKTTAGTWRRQPGRFGRDLVEQLQVGEAHGVLAAPELQQHVGDDEHGDAPASSHSRSGARKVMTGASCSGFEPLATPGDEADQVEQPVAVGAEREVVGAGAADAAGDVGRAARRRPRRSGRGSWRWRSGPRGRRPVSGSTSSSRPTSGSSSSRGSTTSIASTSWRWPARRSGRSHSPAARKSETTTTRPRRRVAAAEALERRPRGRTRRGGRPRPRGGPGAAGPCRLLRPPRAGSVDGLLALEHDGADAVAACAGEEADGRRWRPGRGRASRSRRCRSRGWPRGRPGSSVSSSRSAIDSRTCGSMRAGGDVPVDAADVVARLRRRGSRRARCRGPGRGRGSRPGACRRGGG